MPEKRQFRDAASLPVAYGTAHRMLVTHNTVKKGNRVLILGASGGVGTGCVILCKQLGAEVIACASSAEKMAKLKEIGADEAINYTEVDFSKWAIERYGKPQRRTYDGGVDVVINFTGGDTWLAVAALAQTRRQAARLRRDGRIRSQGGSALRVELRAPDHRLEFFL